MSRESISQRLSEIEVERAELLAEQERLLSLSDDRRLAEDLHSQQCNWNHTDGCGWFYEFDNGNPKWNGHAHARYLEKARNVMRMLPEMSVDEILRVTKALR